MLAPPVAKPKAKTASNNKTILHRAAPLGQRHGDAEPAQMLWRLPQGDVSHAHATTGQDAGPARASANARTPGLSWNFSNVPAYSPGREMPFQRPPFIATPRLPIQAKLKVGAVNDPLEHEADRVAEQVMRMPDPRAAMTSAPPQVSRKCDACEEEAKLQKKSAGLQFATSEAPASVHEVLRSPGQPLDAATRAYFEPRFGQDFSDVRVHAGATAAQSARDVNALAYTVGQNIAFDSGRFAPGSQEGRRLIAHELAHVVQQLFVPMVQRKPVDPKKATGGPDPGHCAPGPGHMEVPWKAGHKTKDTDIKYRLVVTPGHFCDMHSKTVAYLQYERNVWIRTAKGHEAILRIYATADLNPPFDPRKSDFQQLHAPAWSSGHWEVEVKYAAPIAGGLTYWHTPPEGNYSIHGAELALAQHVKAQAPPFVHFGLSPAKQRQTLEAFVQQSAEAEIPEERKRAEEERKRIEEWKKKHPLQESHQPPSDVPVPSPDSGSTVTKPAQSKQLPQAAEKEAEQEIEPQGPIAGVQTEEELAEEKAKQKKTDDDPWYAGLLRALGTIAMGFATVLLLADAIFFVAAGAITFGAAFLIAGAIFLIWGFVSALRNRGGQSAYRGRPGAGIFRSFLDTIGATGIEEARTGKDVATGRKLTPGERVERGVTGGVALGTFLYGGLKKAFGGTATEPPVAAPRAPPTEPPVAAPRAPPPEPPVAAPRAPPTVVKPPTPAPEPKPTLPEPARPVERPTKPPSKADMEEAAAQQKVKVAAKGGKGSKGKTPKEREEPEGAKREHPKAPKVEPPGAPVKEPEVAKGEPPGAPVKEQEPEVAKGKPPTAPSAEPLGPTERTAKQGTAKSSSEINKANTDIDDYLRKRGHSVETNPLEGQEGAGRQGDRFLDGIKTEYKTLDKGATSATVRNAVNNSIKRGGQARQIILDARGSGLTVKEAKLGIRRAMDISRGKIDKIMIIGNGFDI